MLSWWLTVSALSCWCVIVCESSCEMSFDESTTGIGVAKVTFNSILHCAYLGVRYADPPIGRRRFGNTVLRAPSGVENYTVAGNICPQFKNSLKMDAVIGSEDCLFANIYAPLPVGLSTAAAPNLHPVLVFVHGGSFMTGHGEKDVHGVDLLVESGVLVVTFNYRLTMFGFLKSEEYNIRGNFGLKDQTVLLRWVSQYIRHFNGDPDRVTLVGHSAGAGAVTHHLYIPQSKNLFHRMIALSGSPLAPWSLLYNHEHCPDNYVNDLNITSEEDFYTKDFREFFIHTREKKYLFQFASVPCPCFIPVEEQTDDFSLASPHESVLREPLTKVPILLSETGKEFETLTKFVDALRFFPNFPHHWTDSKLSSFNSSLDAFTASTVAAGQANNSSEVIQQIANFANLVYPVRRFAKDLIRVLDPATPVYYQRFEYDGRFGQAKYDYYRYFLRHSAYGAMHGDELGYIFSPYIVEQAFAEPEEYREEWTVHRRMVELVANFARYGDPTPTHKLHLNITWPAVNRDSSHFTYLNIDKTLELRSFEDNVIFDWWEKVYNCFYYEACDHILH